MPGVYPVAESSHGFDHLSGHAELHTQSLNVHVDGASLDVGSRVPNRLQQMCSGLYAPARLSESQQDLEFSGSEAYLAPTNGDAGWAARSILRAPIRRVSDGRPSVAFSRRRMAPTRSTSSGGLKGLVR